MYKCEKCGVQVGHKVPAMRKVEETREKIYTEVYQDESGEVHERYIGEGTEIVREHKLCHLCYGVEVPPEAKPEYHTPEEPQPVGVYSLKLGNGREVTTDKPEELWWFAQSNGASIQPPKRTKGGKSKGARTKGKKGVGRTSDERV